jgi:hypothetical protein
MVDVNPTISIRSVKDNSLNVLLKDRLSEKIFQELIIDYSKVIYTKLKHQSQSIIFLCAAMINWSLK